MSLSPGAMRRFIKREGRDATLRTFALTGEDSFKDPTGSTETTTSLKALVRLIGSSPGTTVFAGGERVEVDAEVVISDEHSVDPEATDEWPRLDVGSERYVILAVDPNSSPGSQRLLATRE